MAPISRRRFLKTTSAWAGGLSVLGGVVPAAEQWARAASPFRGTGPLRRYVFCYFDGGWDVLMSLDPRSPGKFRRERVPETLIEPAYDMVAGVGDDVIDAGGGMLLGPAIGDLAAHADKLAIIRGLSMETLEHGSARQRFLTGLSAEQLRDPDHRPHQQPTDLIATQAAMPPTDVSGGPPSHPTQANPLGVGRTLTDRDLWSLVPLDARIEAETRLMGHFSIDAATTGPDAAAARAAAAITRGHGRVVRMTIQTDLDSHDDAWANQHGTLLKGGFDAVARLITWLGREQYLDTGQSWLDHTIIVGFSEFGRSALRNRRGGRDHALSNACFLAGGPVIGGQVFGATSDTGMLASPVDLATGRGDDKGEVVRPEHLLQTLLVDTGLGPDAGLHAAPLGGLLKSG